METWIALVIVCEAILIVACVFGFLHEDKIIRIEHAFVKAVVWTLWEKVTHREVEFDG